MTTIQKNKLKKAKINFKQGNFTISKDIFTRLLVECPNNTKVLIYNGYISLLENRLLEAVQHLEEALCRLPNSKAIKTLLVDAYYRLDDFANASVLMSSLNRKSLAAKLNYMSTKKVYEIFTPVNRTEITFIKKDPLPLIQLRVNGAPAVNFLIDTGGGELIIDSTYAKTLDLQDFGSDLQIFGGGKKGGFTHSYIDSLQLGEFQLNNLPVILLDTNQFSVMYENEYKVSGILGTNIINHFLTTLDYVNEKIVFEILGETSEKALEERLQREAFQTMPFWMGSDHFMFARGRVNGSDEMLFFIDTGLGGNAFTCPKSTLKMGHLTLKKDEMATGTGGGGQMKCIPFDIAALSMGSISEKNLHGAFGPFPPTIENDFGFKVGGLISHEFFSNHTVIFDFSNMLLHIK